jgi:hypothetical protein
VGSLLDLHGAVDKWVFTGTSRMYAVDDSTKKDRVESKIRLELSSEVCRMKDGESSEI